MIAIPFRFTRMLHVLLPNPEAWGIDDYVLRPRYPSRRAEQHVSLPPIFLGQRPRSQHTRSGAYVSLRHYYALEASLMVRERNSRRLLSFCFGCRQRP